MKIRDLDLSNNPINAEHAELGLPPVENQLTHPASHPVLRVAMWSVVFLLMALTIALATRLFAHGDVSASLVVPTSSSSPTSPDSVSAAHPAPPRTIVRGRTNARRRRRRSVMATGPRAGAVPRPSGGRSR